MIELSGQQIGEAGEHYVLFHLYRLGYIGGQVARGTAGTDLLVARPDGTQAALVQVKTSTKRDSWLMAAKNENIVADNLFYVLVGMIDEPPSVHVIPSAVVADVITRAHNVWASTPGRAGRTRNRDVNTRLLRSFYGWEVPGYPEGWMEQYRNAWHLLDDV